MISISIFINIVAAFIGFRKSGSIFNIFTIVNSLFMLCGLVYIFDPLGESGSVFRTLSGETILFITLFSLFFAILTTQIKSPAKRTLRVGRLSFVFGNLTLFLFVGTIVTISTGLLIYKNGMRLPISLMSESFASGRGAHYSEFDIPFVTPLALGLSRLLFIVLALDYLFSHNRLVDHLKENWLLYSIAVTCTLMTLASGRRNVLFWPILYFAIVYSIREYVSFKSSLRLGLVFLGFSVVFSVIGNYRTGAADRQASMAFLKQPVDLPIFGTAWAWMARYTGASYSNLNVMVEYPMERTYGMLTVSEVIPDFLLSKFVEIPPQPIDYMKENKLLPYFGNTFRTFFSDVYSDFGYVGSLIFGCLLYWGCIVLFNRCGYNIRSSYLFLVFLPGLFMFPFLNQFTGLPTLTSMLFVPFFRLK